MPDENEKAWLVRDVSERTRRLVKVYAIDNSLTIAETLEFLIDTAFDSQRTGHLTSRWRSGSYYLKITNPRNTPTPSEVATLLARVTEVKEQIRKGADFDIDDLDKENLVLAGLLTQEEVDTPPHR